MNKAHRILILLLCACMLFGGCGGGSDEPAPTRQGQTLPARTTEAETKSGGDGMQTEEVIEIYDLTEDMVSVDESSGMEYVNSIIIIYFDENVSEEERQQIAAGIGGTIVGRIDVLDQIQVRVAASDLAGLQKICEELEKDPRVDLAVVDGINHEEAREPQYILEGKYLSWDPRGRINRNWWLLAVDAPRVWAYKDLLSTVKVGIVDAGFDFSHPDLKNVIQRVSGSEKTLYDHGTHVAGIIGAEQNGIGISGIAPNAKLLAYAVKPGLLGVPDSRVYAGITAVLNEGAKVVNVSMGSINELDDLVSYLKGREASRFVGKMIAGGKDLVIIQSAGNGAGNAYHTGLFSSITAVNCNEKYASKKEIMGRIIIVADARREGDGYMLSDHSCGGANVDLCAPGTNIYSTVTAGFSKDLDGYRKEDGLYDRNQSDAMYRDCSLYGYQSGTSMSAPVVSGVAALVWGADPKLTGLQVKQLICDVQNTKYEAEDNPDTDAKGDFPMVNAWLPTLEALTMAGKTDKDGNVPGEETTEGMEESTRAATPPETTAVPETTVPPETTAALTEEQKKARKLFHDFLKNATEGGDFYPIAPDWLYVDNAYFYTTYLARFGLADADFDGEEELILYWNQMSQEGTVYVYDADLKYGDCTAGNWSKSFPTLGTDADLIYYSKGSVEFVDHKTGYSHFGVVDRNFWKGHPELALPEYLQYYTYLSVPQKPVNGTYHCLINDSADRAGRDLNAAQMEALLKDLRAGESILVELYPVTQENIDRVLQ